MIATGTPKRTTLLEAWLDTRQGETWSHMYAFLCARLLLSRDTHAILLCAICVDETCPEGIRALTSRIYRLGGARGPASEGYRRRAHGETCGDHWTRGGHPPGYRH